MGLFDEMKVAEELILHPEDYKPKPGGLIDKHRQERARREASERLAEQAAERIEESAFRTVKVSLLTPESFTSNLITIPAGGSAMILPLSPYRSGATITQNTAAGSVILTNNQAQAVAGLGVQLFNGVPLPVRARGQLWGYNPGASPIQVGVLAELYAPERKD